MDMNFLTKDPCTGAKLLFEKSNNLSNQDLWNVFDFLLWEYQERDIDTLFHWYGELMSIGLGFNNAFITGHKFVCAATIKEGDPIYRCKTCQMDGTNLLCVACFKNSDHHGHDWTPTFTPGSGCCDCGDPESWDTKGFCTHHPGPNAGENIKISPNLERVSRLLCGYIIYILSHALSPTHHDVLYVDEKTAKHSHYVQSRLHCKKKKSPSHSSGMFGGLFNFGGDDDEEQENDEKCDDDIINRYHTFIQLLHNDCADNNILIISSQEYLADGSDYIDAGEAENCALGWRHPKDVCLQSIKCDDKSALEIVWKLRMYNQCKLVCGEMKYVSSMAKIWQQYEYINPDAPPYTTQIMKEKKLTRVISGDILLKIIIELKNWSSNSEILKRIIASVSMLNIADLSPQCSGLNVIGKLSVHESDDMKVNDCDTLIYHLILNDHILGHTVQSYNAPLIDLWFALIVLPYFKQRVTQVFTYCYGKMISFWDFINRKTQHCFVPLSVQFFTKLSTINVCESHGLISTIFTTHLLQSCPAFVKDYNTNENKSLDIFNPGTHKAKWTSQWMLSKKSTHCLYDLRYLLSIHDFMQYVCCSSERGDPMTHFWKPLLNLLCTYNHSKYEYRRCGREHILMEDQTMVNILRLDSTINGINHRYLLHGLYHLFKNSSNKTEINILLDILLYGLSIINEKSYDDSHQNIRMKLYNLDDGYLHCPYLRADRDMFTLTLNLSKTLCNISKLYCDITGNTFTQLIEKLHALNHCEDKQILNENIFYWIDFSLQFISVFNQFHSDLLRKNGGIFATMIYNMEKPNFFSLFFTHNFYHIAHNATERFGASNFLTLLFHRHCLYDWFVNDTEHKMQLSCDDEDNEFDLDALSSVLETGWRHWQDAKRVRKMIKNCLNELLAIICEPSYTLMLDNTDNFSLLVIRYELIQWLIFSPHGFAMSELESRVIIFGKIKRIDIRPILNDISDYEAPLNMDAGKFKLKPEFYNEFNPYYRKYSKFNEYFNCADQQSEAIENYMQVMRKYNKTKEVMFPNWPITTQLTSDSQINVLTAPFIGLIWNTILYHMYINDKARVSVNNFQQILRLISVAIQAIIENRFDLSSTLGGKLIQNFVKKDFKIRLTNEWDYIQDDSKQEIIKKYHDQHTKDNKHMEVHKNKPMNNENDKDKDNEYKQTEDKYYTQALSTYNKLIMNQNGIGIGSNVWLLCKILIESKAKTMTHIEEPQLLLIEKILGILYAMNIPTIQNIISPLWSPPSLNKKKKKKKKKVKLTAAEKRKLRAQKRQAKIQAQMKAKNEGFGKFHQEEIKKDEMMQELEEKQQAEAFGIGMSYQCIVCRSRDKQDSMSMMAFATKCCIMDKLLNNKNMPFVGSDKVMKNEQENAHEWYNRGINFSFCGHCVHKSCHDTYSKQIQSAHNNSQHYAGRGSINILKKEFCCPYCKTVSNILVPLQIVHRNKKINVEKYKLQKTMQEIEISDMECKDYNMNGKMTVIRKKLCTDFFTSLFCIWDRYQHSRTQHSDYCDKIGAIYSTLTICNALTYSINCQEIIFRDLAPHSRKDRLNRIVTNINTFIAALWLLARQTNYQMDKNSHFKMIKSTVFDQDIIQKYSWQVIKRKMLNHNNKNEAKENDFPDKYCYDPFSLLCRGVICYNTTFSFKNLNFNIHINNQQSNVRMDTDDEDEDEDEGELEEKEDNSASDLYTLLLACYIMQITQLLISYSNKIDKSEIIKYLNNNKDNWKDIIIGLIPFLRRCCLLYNSFGCVDIFGNNLDDLWMDSNENECNALCDILHIARVCDIFESILNDNNKYFLNYIDNINNLEITYFLNKRKNNEWDKCETFSLIKLPLNYNDLFQLAAFSKCKRKDIRPKYSAICLICGCYVCLSCCTFGIEQRGDATRHCLECNNGFGVFLWLQKSKVIIIWNNLGALFKSVYLDKYGEEDCGLIRGNRITLNSQRYHQLCQIITQHGIPNKVVQLRKTNRDLLERQLAL